MKITNRHQAAAGRLVGSPPHLVGRPRAEAYEMTAPAGYLAAVERIDAHDDGGLYASGVGGVEPDGSTWTTSGLANPAELREHAYALLVLADEAEARR